MDFRAPILILRMEEDMQHFWRIMLYYFKKGKNATETQKKICAVNEGAVTEWTCQKWFAKFLGTTDILAKKFFAVGLSHALEDVWQHPSLYPLEANSGRQPTYSKYPNQ